MEVWVKIKFRNMKLKAKIVVGEGIYDVNKFSFFR